MRVIVDTSVAIYLRDDHFAIRDAVKALPRAPMISVLTRVELEGGIYRNPAEAPLLRSRLDLLLRIMPELPFTTREAAIYGRIVERCGYSRARVIDRSHDRGHCDRRGCELDHDQRQRLQGDTGSEA